MLTAAVAVAAAAAAAAAAAVTAAAAAATEAQHKLERGLLLDVVVRKCTAIHKLLARKDQPLLVLRNSFFVLDLCLDVVNSVRCHDVQGDGLACEVFDKELHRPWTDGDYDDDEESVNN